jgi:hypothetical protein
MVETYGRNGRGVIWLLSLLAAPAWGAAGPQAQEVTLTLKFSTYLEAGAGGTLREADFDSRGNVVVVGHGDFTQAAFPHAMIIGKLDDANILVAKLSAAEGKLLWVTLIGGVRQGGRDRGYGLRVGPDDCIYLAGRTSSSDFPTTAGAHDRSHNGGHSAVSSPHGPTDGYALKLSSDGRRLLYSTFLGGSRDDGFRGGLALDRQGCAYLCGTACSADYPGFESARVNGFLGGYSDATLTKLAPDGAKVLWSRFLGSSNDPTGEELPLGARIGAEGNVYAILNVWGSDAAVTPDAYSRIFNGGRSDLYFVKVSADGKQLLYASYFGGSGSEFAEHALVLDGAGNACFAGATSSPDFPVVNAADAELGGTNDAFLVKLNAAGRPVFSTYIGGSGNEESVFGPALDPKGNIYVAGLTSSEDFPTTPLAYDRTYNGGERDAVVQVYSPAGRLLTSTFLGGRDSDYARFVAADKTGNIVVVGETNSRDFPTTRGAHATTFKGKSAAFVTKFSVTTDKTNAKATNSTTRKTR